MTKEEFELLELELKQSGKTVKEFLANKGIGNSKFYYWKQKFLQNEKDAELTPIRIKSTNLDATISGTLPSGATLLFPNGLRAHFGSGTEKVLMELLIQSLDCHVLP